MKYMIFFKRFYQAIAPEFVYQQDLPRKTRIASPPIGLAAPVTKTCCPSNPKKDLWDDISGEGVYEVRHLELLASLGVPGPRYQVSV